MLTPYGVGCAYVRMGAWSYLLINKRTHVFFFELNGCHLLAMSASSTTVCLT